MKDDDWLIGVCQDLCAYAEKNNLRNVSSAAEYALQVAIQEVEAPTRLKRLVNPSQASSVGRVCRRLNQGANSNVISFPDA